MKKRALFIFISAIILLSLIIILIKAEQPPMPVMPNIPIVGDINPETGLPKTFKKFQQVAENLSSEELRKQYLKREWTIILAKNPILGPTLFYTENFFSFFNPVWRIVFGMEFSWAWNFFFALIIWIMLIIIFYSPSRALTNINPIITVIASVILASLMGTTGVIRTATNFLSTFLSNIWLVGIAILIAGFGIALYTKIFGEIGKTEKARDKKEKLERAEDKIKATGDVAGKFLEGDK